MLPDGEWTGPAPALPTFAGRPAGFDYGAAVRGFEGFRARPHWDHKQWSVGYGTRASGPDDVVDEAEGRRRFDTAFGRALSTVDAFRPGLDAGTRHALASLTYNAGDAWTRSGLGAAVQAGDMDRARASFLQYVNASGQPNAGLQARRAQEVAWLGRGDTGTARPMTPAMIDPDSELAGLFAAFGRRPGMAGVPMTPAAAPAAPERAPIISTIRIDDQRRPAVPQPATSPTPNAMGLLGALASGMQSPLFMSGAAMVNAGSQGLNPGAGFLAGGQASQQARQAQLLEDKVRRETESARMREQLWQSMGSGETPEWARSLPPGTLNLARALGPEAGSNLLVAMMQKGAEKAIDRDKLAETTRYHDILARQQQMQFDETQNMNAERRAMMDTMRRQKEAEMESARRAEENRTRMLRGEPPLDPSEAIPSPAPARPAAPPAAVRPMASEADAPEATLIPAQVAAPPASPAPLATPVTPPSGPLPRGMIRLPGGRAVPTEDAQQWAMNALTLNDPGLRAAATQVLKDIERSKDVGGLDRAAKAEVEKTMVSQANHVARLNDMASRFDPKWLTWSERGRMWITGLVDKATGRLTEAQQDELGKYTQFRAITAANLNTLLKELSGAAVTQQEYDRLRMAEPSGGSGGIFDLIDADSPEQYRNKLIASLTGAKMAIARANWLRQSQRLDTDQIMQMAKANTLDKIASLDGMRNVMSTEQRKIENELRRQMKDRPEPEIRDAVRERMKGIFGI